MADMTARKLAAITASFAQLALVPVDAVSVRVSAASIALLVDIAVANQSAANDTAWLISHALNSSSRCSTLS